MCKIMPTKEIEITIEKKEAKTMQYEILRPGGNDTAVVYGIVENKETRKMINDAIMAANPNVEQVGFLDFSNMQSPTVMMAGGEFCGNFLRSCAYLIYLKSNRKISESVFQFKLEDRVLFLKAGCDGFRTGWAEIPFQSDSIFISKTEKFQIIELQGITHIVTNLPPIDLPTEIELRKNVLKLLATQFLEENGLKNLIQERPALGVMFTSRRNGKIFLEPVVWVDELSFFYETACGSGTGAVGAAESQRVNGSVKLSVQQPTGLPIEVDVDWRNGKISQMKISGFVSRLLAKKKIIIS